MPSELDAVAFLRGDHKSLNRLFQRFDAALERGGSVRTVEPLARQILREVQNHSEIEERIFYPTVLQVMGEEEALIRVAQEQHHVVDLLLAELACLDVAHERFIPKMIVLIEGLLEHIHDEEEELFPRVLEALNRKSLVSIARALKEARGGTAPTDDHEPVRQPHASQPTLIPSRELRR